MIELPLPPGYDLLSTVAFSRLGFNDPSCRLTRESWQRAVWTLDGPCSFSVEVRSQVAHCSWEGPFPHEQLPDVLGLTDDLPELDLPYPPIRLAGWPFVHDVVLRRIFEQRVAWTDAARSHRKLLERFGTDFGGLRCIDPARVRRLSAGELGWLEVDPQRGRALTEVGLVWKKLDRLREPEALRRAIKSLVGCGPWTAEWTAGLCLPDQDAVPTGDFGLPNQIAWNLAREPRADDARMLELLEPYRGQRFRVVRMVMWSGEDAPRFGPRMDPPASRLDRR